MQTASIAAFLGYYYRLDLGYVLAMLYLGVHKRYADKRGRSEGVWCFWVSSWWTEMGTASGTRSTGAQACVMATTTKD